MTDKEKNDLLFESIVKVAVKQALDKEIAELPSEEELGEEYKPSEELDRRIKDIIESKLAKQNKRRIHTKLTKIAACVCIFLGASAAVLLNVEATRTVILNAFISFRENHTEIQFKDSVISDGIYRPVYLPKGFNETSNV